LKIKKTIIEYLVKEGVTSEEITGIMQMRCRDKKKVPGVTEKKTSEAKEENELNGATDENNDVSIGGEDGNDNSDLIKEEITPKRNAQRTAKEKVTKYDGDNDEEDDESIIHGMEMDEEEESDYMGSDSDTEKKLKKALAKPKQPRKPKSAASNAAKKKSPVNKNGLNGVTEKQENNNETSPKSKTEKPKKPRAKKESGSTPPKKEPVKKEPKKEIVKKRTKKSRKTTS